MKITLLSLFWSSPKMEVTEDIVQYYKEHPEELDLLVDKESFHTRFLAFFFILGLSLSLLARTLKYFFQSTWGDFVGDVLLDLVSELGIAIFGGAVVAFFIEYLQTKQYEQNMLFREEIKKCLEN